MSKRDRFAQARFLSSLAFADYHDRDYIFFFSSFFTFPWSSKLESARVVQKGPSVCMCVCVFFHQARAIEEMGRNAFARLSITMRKSESRDCLLHIICSVGDRIVWCVQPAGNDSPYLSCIRRLPWEQLRELHIRRKNRLTAIIGRRYRTECSRRSSTTNNSCTRHDSFRNSLWYCVTNRVSPKHNRWEFIQFLRLYNVPRASLWANSGTC